MCGYNLHRLRGSKCPECGQALELRVALVNPRLGLFYTGLVGLAAGVGFASLVFLWGLIMILSQGGPEIWHLTLLAGEAIAMTLLLLTWIRCSGRFRLLTTAQRGLLASSTWLVSIAMMFIFVLAVR